MAKNPTPTRWTYAEFAKLPEGDGNRYEVIAGELYVSPSPGIRHQRVLTKLLRSLGDYVDSQELGDLLVGPIDVLFAEGDYLAPDLVFVRRERMSIESKRGIEAAPDLVVEILSPSTARRDRNLKRDRYQHFGVPEYWIVDPDKREIIVHGKDRSIPEVCSRTLTWQPSADKPGLDLDIAGLFPAES
jgi:Uma2 family endonuclease